MGTGEYPPLAERFQVPIVVTGFEPLDILEGIRRTVHQLEGGRHEVENAYARAVQREGNPRREPMLDDVFEVGDRSWRGIGMIPQSGWRLSERYRAFDAEHRFSVGGIQTQESERVPQRRGAPGADQAARVRGVRQGVHAAQPARRDDGLQRGRVRGLLPLPPARCTAAASGAGSEEAEPTLADRPRRPDFEGWTCPLPLRDSPTIVMGHGGGGAMSAELVEHLFLPAFGEVTPRRSSATPPCCTSAGTRLAFSTDSFVVRPLFFPGGCIGDLAVNGTVNDLAMSGAARRSTSRRASSSRRAPTSPWSAPSPSGWGPRRARAGVRVVTGDTKVVDAGHGDGIYVNTAGIGVVPDGVDIRAATAPRPGDVVIVSGDIGVHGVAIMSVREGLRVRHRDRQRLRAPERAGGGDAGGHRRPPRAARPHPRRAWPPR